MFDVVNRVGFEGKHAMAIPARVLGQFFVAIPSRQNVPKASNDKKEETIVVECDPAKVKTLDANWPFLRDRRSDGLRPNLKSWMGE